MKKLKSYRAITLLLFIFWIHCTGSTEQINASRLDSPPQTSSPMASSPASRYTKKSCKLSTKQKALRISGITLASLGLASLITGGVLWGIHGQPSGPCSPDGIREYSACKWSSQGAATLALGLGGAGVLGGGLMIGFSYGDSSKSTACE